MSAGQYINKCSGSSIDPLNLADCKSRNHLVDNLDMCLPQHLNDEGDGNPTRCDDESPKKNDFVNSSRGGRKNLGKSDSSASNKSFKNRKSFQALGDPKSSADELSFGKKPQANGGTDMNPEVNNCAQSLHESCSEASLLPTPVRLVSSMKGSREKQGISPKKLSVTWAPDVYDPIPTSVSHVPNNNQNRRRDGKKYRKNKKNGGAGKSDASRNNDKKPKKKKKKNGGTNNCKPMPDDSVVVGISEPQSSILDFDGATLKPSCGKSFLMTSIDKMHFPVAEAT